MSLQYFIDNIFLHFYHRMVLLIIFNNSRSGDTSSLQVDAIVNSTNEYLTDCNPISDRIFQRAGPGLKEEIRLDIKGKKVTKLRYFL